MPKENSSKGIQITLNPIVIGALVGMLSIVGVIWKVGSNVATKTDVESIKTALTPVLDRHEDRIRALEIQMARYFGASQTSLKPSGLQEDEESFHIVLAQYQPQAIPSSPAANAARQQMEIPRRVVVPEIMILQYNLQPSRGGVYALLGEDGKYYGLDDVLAVLIRMHLQESQVRQKK